MNSVLLGGFLAAMATGLPIAIAMALAALLYIWISGTIPPLTVVHRMVGGVDSFPLLAVPFFILAGNLMNSAGITNRIYNFALALVGWLKGGLGHVNVVGSVIFAGMSGTAIADAGGLGTIEIKAMKDHGYPTEFALGITAASATLGPIIPPSLPMVIYGVQANVSIGKLFAGGFIPGAVMALFMMAMVALLRPRSQIRFRHRVLVAAHGTRVLRAGVRADHRDGALLPVVARGAARLAALRRTARRHDGRRQAVQVRGLHGAADPGDPDRRHGHRPVHADRGGGRCGRLGAIPRLHLVSNAQLAHVRQDLDGDDRDHGGRAVHRRRGIDLRLGTDHDADDGRDRQRGAVDLGPAVGVPAAREPVPAVRRLLHGDDRRDHDSGAGVHADHREARHRPGAFRAW